MATIGEEIVEEFAAKGWKTNPFDKLIPLLQERREQALPLALMIIERIPQGGTFFDLLLSHLTEREFKQVVDVAVARLAVERSDVLDSTVAYASLQFPLLLRPYLRSLFNLCPNSGSYYEEWPWRGADSEEIGRLMEIVNSGDDDGARKRAWRRLVETRQADCITFACRTFPPELDRGGGFEAYAKLAGFDGQKSPPRRLHTETAYHIIFPSGYFDDSTRPAWNSHTNHPTWALDGPPVAEAVFGGTSNNRCGSCGGLLHRIILFDNADVILGIRLPKVDLCTCLSCLGWEQPELFFCHDASGVPFPHCLVASARKPEFPAEPLQISPVSLQVSPSRWQLQDWALSNSRENLNRIGGAPSWIQDSQYPQCPGCRELMIFIAQFDSNLPTIDGGEWLWGSGGIAYFFWCDSCAISGSLWQCT